MKLLPKLKNYREEWYAFKDTYHVILANWILLVLHSLEGVKTFLVRLLYRQRGRFAQPATHFFLTVFVFLAIYLSPYLEDALSSETNLPSDYLDTQAALAQTSLYVPQTGQTNVRGDIVEYIVKKGETLSAIAKKFDVSLDTIIWANNLRSPKDIRAGQRLKIPPVTGIVHRVRRGETVYSLAKKYRTDPQKIVDFPFNTFANDETFALKVGQVIIIPDGIMPSAKPPPSYYAARRWPVVAGKKTASQFIWPTSGVVTQGYSWYHRAIDIANPAAPNILAAAAGTVERVIYGRYGYGHHVIIDHGNGYKTLYAHMTRIYVHPGQKVAQGQPIGRMGSTGHSTGTHLHFEIRRGRVRLNPLSFLK